MKVGDRVRYVKPDAASKAHGVVCDMEGVVVYEKGVLDEDGKVWDCNRVKVDGLFGRSDYKGAIFCDESEVEVVGGGKVVGGFRMRPIGLMGGVGDVEVVGTFSNRGEKAIAALRELGWEICE